jgi:hypothetical protein
MPPEDARLPALIQEVSEAGADPLDRLEHACATAGELGTVADLLVNHFVVQARDAGLSWTQIGSRMGVTKQAARKRFLPPDIPEEPATRKERLYGRYTEPAKRTVALAQRIAQEHHHHYIGPEHLLLGLCAQKDAALTASGGDPEAIADAVRQRLLPPSAEVPERLPFTEKGKKVLILAAQHAKRRGDDWIGTEHLLLGLIDPPGIAADVLAGHGVTAR